jgi:signal transduction histidine kinase
MNMKSPFGIRLWFLIAAVIAVAGATIFGLSTAWHRVQQLESKLSGSRIESFRLAAEVQRDLLNLNNFMLRYAMVRNPQQWAQFQQAGGDLERWIHDRDPSRNPKSSLATEPERQSFQELTQAYGDYLAAARAIHSNAQPALVVSGQLGQLDAFDVQAQRMRELAGRLAEVHRRAEAGFLASANADLSNLRTFLNASVMLLLTLVAAMGWVIYRDMIAPLRTKLVQSQTLLEKQEKLATLGTLAAGIAHEIRNPLTSLKARLYTLEKHLQAVPAARKDTDIIGAEISRLERIVKDVLSFARPSDPKLETISAEAVIREVQGLMSPDLERRGVQLVVESSAGLLIRADSAHLKQVLINLVRNAAEATDGAGKVTLGARATRAHLGKRESEAVILEVADRGGGIPPEVEKRLFDPFFTTKESGSGLGLSIAARIVEKHGGTLQYRTQVGHGTTFGVVLPREMSDAYECANGEISNRS